MASDSLPLYPHAVQASENNAFSPTIFLSGMWQLEGGSNPCPHSPVLVTCAQAHLRSLVARGMVQWYGLACGSPEFNSQKQKTPPSTAGCAPSSCKTETKAWSQPAPLSPIFQYRRTFTISTPSQRMHVTTAKIKPYTCPHKYVHMINTAI